MTPKRTLLSRLLILFSLALFAASLLLPALLFEDAPPVMGGEVLGWGWWGFLTGNFAWLANPIFLLSLYLLSKRKIGLARLATASAVVLGLQSYAAHEWWFNEGVGTPIIGLGTAFYIWMSSLVAVCLASLAATAPAMAVDQEEEPHSDPPDFEEPFEAAPRQRSAPDPRSLHTQFKPCAAIQP